MLLNTFSTHIQFVRGLVAEPAPDLGDTTVVGERSPRTVDFGEEVAAEKGIRGDIVDSGSASSSESAMSLGSG